MYQFRHGEGTHVLELHKSNTLTILKPCRDVEELECSSYFWQEYEMVHLCEKSVILVVSYKTKDAFSFKPCSLLSIFICLHTKVCMPAAATLTIAKIYEQTRFPLVEE